MREKGYECRCRRNKKDIIARDEADMQREVSPLKKADDANFIRYNKNDY